MSTSLSDQQEKSNQSSGLLSGLSDSKVFNSNTPRLEESYGDFTYDRLPTDRRLIRVMVLRGSGKENPEVDCELETVDFQENGASTHPYEALSWCWGSAEPTGTLIIRKGGTRLQRKVTPDLVAALKALRYQQVDRHLWIDQICVDQANPSEKNHQVAMMSEIYGRASKVCIWLGEGTPSSHEALEFIKNKVLQLQNFDELCEDKQVTDKWNDLLVLMQRPWFSRRWVVQEVALAHQTVLYCGRDTITWKEFAVAVELFVEVETASHRLSEVMKKDPRFYHVPGWFEFVSALGASLLVEATGKLFRDYKPYEPTDPQDNSEDEHEPVSREHERDSETFSVASSDSSEGQSLHSSFSDLPSIKHALGRPLLTLEYLVSTLSIFEVTVPHDAIYALLAIARDTTPTPLADDDKDSQRQFMINAQRHLEVFTEKKRYKVDYKQPFADVCKEFVAFCIEESKDPTRALDIICRPWAPRTDIDRGNRKSSKHRSSRNSKKNKRATLSTPSQNFRRKTSSPQKFVGHSVKGVPLPSWIPTLSGAAFAMMPHAGAEDLKVGRKNADALVGLPPSSQALERNYNAAERRGVDRSSLQFVKRSGMGHWSMYVKGFVLDEITQTHASSQNGAIPSAWAKAGGWDDVHGSDPPNDFWRTLVADRGRDGKNPPVYYSRACKEAFHKGGWATGSVSLSKLINNERCSVIAQFCRRVQSVIWNRCLIVTSTRTGLERLGLSGENVEREDLICILYGCSVPVVLRRHKKCKDDVFREWEDDLDTLRNHITAKYRQRLKKRKEIQEARENIHAQYYLWEHSMREEYLKDLKEAAKRFHDPKKSQEIREQRRKATSHSYDDRGSSFLERPLRGAKSMIFFWQKSNAGRTGDYFLAWLTNRREKHRIPMDMTKVWDDHVFDLRLKWGRRWKTIWKTNEALRKAKKPLDVSGPTSAVTDSVECEKGISGGLVRRWAHGLRAWWWRRSVTDSVEDDSVERGKIITGDDGYIELHKNWYLRPYKTHKRAKELQPCEWERIDERELEEPDWNRAKPEDLLIQQKWSHYEFLGECYVHGMMDGEAMAYQNRAEVPAQVFELR